MKKGNPGLTPNVPHGPESKAHGAKVLFWYLRLYFTIGFVAVSTGSLWYQFINKLVPLQIAPYGGVGRGLSQREAVWAMAAILVVGPAMFASAVVIRNAIRRDEIELGRGVRQWVSYMFLFYVAAIALGDLVTVLRYLLTGDYSLRFFLKSLTILVITGWIFIYVWTGLRAKDALLASLFPRAMGLATAGALVASIVGGFFIIDSPTRARAKAFDRQRVYDLGQVHRAVMQHYTIHDTLPQSLAALQESGLVVERAVTDPKSGEPYEYRVINEIHYEICALFTTENREEDADTDYAGRGARPFLHGPERTCFEQAVFANPSRRGPR